MGGVALADLNHGSTAAGISAFAPLTSMKPRTDAVVRVEIVQEHDAIRAQLRGKRSRTLAVKVILEHSLHVHRRPVSSEVRDDSNAYNRYIEGHEMQPSRLVVFALIFLVRATSARADANAFSISGTTVGGSD